MREEKRLEFEIEGVKCSFSTGLLATKSQVAVTAQMGNTIVLATANIGEAKSDSEYFPLGVEYLESMYASGKISGSRFRKRDGFPSEDAILNRRCIDRTIRPRFPDDYRNEVQVIVKILSYDPEFSPLVIAGNAVSVALQLSEAPFNGPISLVRIGMEGEKPVQLFKAVDRDASMKKEVPMNMVLGGDGDKLTNIDTAAAEYSEEIMVDAMELGVEAMKVWIESQQAFVEMHGKIEKAEYESFATPEELYEELTTKYADKPAEYIAGTLRKQEILDELYAAYEGKYAKRVLDEAWEKMLKKHVRKMAIKDDQRIGNRGMDEIRPLDYRLDMLPMAHGSALFTRGNTQVLAVTTLSSSRDQQLIDDMSGEYERHFFLHYVDSPFVYSETLGRVKYMPGSRQIGHSALAEKAFYPVLPDKDEFPYTVMVTCEVLEEHGSSSMASSTAPTMALMAAGVPIAKHVAGISVGVMFDDDMQEYKLLTDMGESEDFYGFMDFKVAGTRDGVTSVQMDTKTQGLPVKLFKEAFEKARDARMQIISDMEELISEPRPQVAANAPKVAVSSVPVDKIGELIGPGGKNIKQITEDYEVEMNVEDDGKVFIFGAKQESIDKVIKIVEGIGFVPEPGKIYKGKVDSIVDFGAFVKISPSVSGLLHVSEIADDYVENVTDFISEGEVVNVKVLEVDQQGKIKLSLKGVKQPK